MLNDGDDEQVRYLKTLASIDEHIAYIKKKMDACMTERTTLGQYKERTKNMERELVLLREARARYVELTEKSRQ